MNRIEKVREAVDAVLLNIADAGERRCGYMHLYGVSQACVLIALKRNENAELAAAAGMLHDIYTYATMAPRVRSRQPMASTTAPAWISSSPSRQLTARTV